jgi:hypothetical protein
LPAVLSVEEGGILTLACPVRLIPQRLARIGAACLEDVDVQVLVGEAVGLIAIGAGEPGPEIPHLLVLADVDTLVVAALAIIVAFGLTPGRAIDHISSTLRGIEGDIGAGSREGEDADLTASIGLDERPSDPEHGAEQEDDQEDLDTSLGVDRFDQVADARHRYPTVR